MTINTKFDISREDEQFFGKMGSFGIPKFDKIMNGGVPRGFTILALTDPGAGAELFAKPAKTGLNVPIHQDNFYWNTKTGNALTMWIALNESNKKNGGIFYFKKSHKTGLQKHKLSFHPGTSQKLSEKINLKKFKKFTPSLKPGDCIVHNSLIIHGSNKNLSNKTRSGLTLRYISKNEKFDNFKIAKYKKSLEKNVKFLKENN